MYCFVLTTFVVNQMDLTSLYVILSKTDKLIDAQSILAEICCI